MHGESVSLDLDRAFLLAVQQRKRSCSVTAQQRSDLYTFKTVFAAQDDTVRTTLY